MTNKDNILIDTINFTVPLEIDYEEVFWMFSSSHYQECCEAHYLDFDSTEKEFEILENTLSKIDKIEIKWTPDMWVTFFFYDWDKRCWIFVPWRWYNNGYYGIDIQLIVNTPNDWTYNYNVSEYQKIEG